MLEGGESVATQLTAKQATLFIQGGDPAARGEKTPSAAQAVVESHLLPDAGRLEGGADHKHVGDRTWQHVAFIAIRRKIHALARGNSRAS
jgi:hypothetical protein